jgi:Tol biopolymer transport system component
VQNSYTFGQAPSWTPSGEILSQELDRHGILQVYRSKLNGSASTCVTCGKTRGPNGFAQERRQGDWILCCSYGAQPMHLGMPCLGGYGGDLYAIRPDGRDLARLTKSSDPDDGAVYSNTSGTPYDNYHPYWSPDGRHLAWVRTEALPLSRGGQRWEMMLADFIAPKRGRPHLAHIRVVGPAFGVYETQQWAPDGSGFLFTAFGPRNSPFQATAPGWMHQELYFMRLYGRGASPAHPRVTQLTHDTPAYEEQAVFTPDMRDVIFMSNRNSPDGSWYDEVIAAAQRTRFDAPDPGATGTPQFLADFSDPNFRSDLFMVDVRNGDLRQLTDFGNVIPEFNWSDDYSRLIWSGIVGLPNRNFITRVATFPTIPTAQRRPPRAIPAPGLYGHPIEMARVAARTGPSGERCRLPGARRARTAAAGTFVGTKGRDQGTVPAVVGSYYTLWIGQLKRLGQVAGIDLGAPTFLTPP